MVGQDEAQATPAGTFQVKAPKRLSRRLVLFLTVAAAALLVFCYCDTNHNVGRLTGVELGDLINQSAPGELNLSISTGHDHSIRGEYPQMYRYFWVEVRKDGKVAKYTANVDETNLALIAQKKINCPTYVAGRDFEVLGTPGRMLPFLAAFVLATGASFLLKRSRHESSIEAGLQSSQVRNLTVVAEAPLF
jgi:hypothetical protein